MLSSGKAISLDECLADRSKWQLAADMILSGQLRSDRCVEIATSHPEFWRAHISINKEIETNAS